MAEQETKRPRPRPRPATRVSLASALRVLLKRCSDYVSGEEWRVVGRLCLLNRDVNAVIREWIGQLLLADCSRGHEIRPVPVRFLSNENEQVAMVQLTRLWKFQYVTRVQIPLPPAKHALPPEVLCRQRQSEDVQRVLRGRQVDVYAAYDEATGWGVYAAQDIAAGEYIGEYTGELISANEMRHRHATLYDRSHSNYVFVLRELRVDASSAVRTNVDATPEGCFTRFMNHSCAPTTRMEGLRVDSYVPRIVFFAQRAVTKDEELTFAYGSASTDTERASSSTNEPHQRRPCGCGARHCRGVLPFDSEL
ncbi:hypothetical protein Poli38472_013922 [Pythium oligandrum]|uniref:Uncharacterized protein n=1 Tax=Pythium oligandrum TaxID=41045 RepID=A0A8K1C2C9_PYTOL|nr:hypothetical protein Poli38472_013922 [Pythium oligandrum]|eukprot:TMW55160.1 hypothetical protein Poli38472_013922 [Pythium oligandrum]